MKLVYQIYIIMYFNMPNFIKFALKLYVKLSMYFK